MIPRTLISRPSSGKWNKQILDFQWHDDGGVKHLVSPLLKTLGFLAVFSSRRAGCSRSPYDSMNLALTVADDTECVLENRRRLCSVLGVEHGRLTTAEQIHEAQVIAVGDDSAGRGAFSADDAIVGADALITKAPSTPLTLFFADCVPIILADPEADVIGIAHAGRRGTLLGIAERLAETMTRDFGASAETLLACLGPSIGACCYRVDSNIASEFAKTFPLGVVERDGHYYLSLAAINRFTLVSFGLDDSHIYDSDLCTSCNDSLFYSYRRDGVTGRQAALAAVLP